MHIGLMRSMQCNRWNRGKMDDQALFGSAGQKKEKWITSFVW